LQGPATIEFVSPTIQSRIRAAAYPAPKAQIWGNFGVAAVRADYASTRTHVRNGCAHHEATWSGNLGPRNPTNPSRCQHSLDLYRTGQGI